MLDWIKSQTRAQKVSKGTRIQSLWSGYGEIYRVQLEGADYSSAVVKHVAPPQDSFHPKGWNTNLSHQRKLRSYQVEQNFYQSYSAQHLESFYVPSCYGVRKLEGQWGFVLEDLDASGYAGRAHELSLRQMKQCLDWLASFHANYLKVSPRGLWEVGSYWHLETRPDELLALEHQGLKQHAAQIDAVLNACAFPTFVHGDAKPANFCFSPAKEAVAAVDFQYVGGGCGIKDVVYFFCSALDEDDCDEHAELLLEHYFGQLGSLLEPKLGAEEWGALEAEWRQLYPFAWADFYRFLLGWAPGHYKLNQYGMELVERLLKTL